MNDKNETAATIKQLSQELHVTEQALRQWCKRNGVQKTTKGKVTSYFLSANDVEQIRKHYTAQRKQSHNKSTSIAQRNESNYVSLSLENEALKKQLIEKEKELGELKHKISALTEFNIIHHKAIDSLEQDKKQLNERLTKAENDRTELISANKELTIALKAAQALHGMDKQQAVIELKEPAAQDQTEPPRKPSLFSRMFHRK